MKFPHFNFGCFFGERKHKDNPFSFTSLTHYDLFAVHLSADFEEIRKNYRALMKIYHPDKNPNGKKMAQILNHTYTTLYDPEKRAYYDLTGKDKEETNDDDKKSKRKCAQSGSGYGSNAKEERDQNGKDGNSFTYYDVFGVHPSANAKEIHEMYIKLLAIYQPDNGLRMMQILNYAYITLSDPQKRAEYDQDLTTESEGNQKYVTLAIGN